jgi:hypothetical protein
MTTPDPTSEQRRRQRKGPQYRRGRPCDARTGCTFAALVAEADQATIKAPASVDLVADKIPEAAASPFRGISEEAACGDPRTGSIAESFL